MTDLVPALPAEVPGWVAIVAPLADLSERIARTELVPQWCRNRPDAVFAAALRGQSLGFDPLEAVNAIFVINGTPGLYAETMRALVLAAGHDIWPEETSATRVTYCARRRGTDHVIKETWDMDRARRAKLAGRPQWQTYPQEMLVARASASLVRMVFPDVIKGLYAVEELEDAGDASANGSTPAHPAPLTKRRKAAAANTRVQGPAPEPQPEPAPALPPLPDEPLEVGGKEAPEPAAPEQPQPAAEPKPKRPLSPAQRVAMEARSIEVDHHDVVEVITNGRARSANDCNEAQLAAVYEALRRIRTGEITLVRDEAGLRLVDTPEVGPITADQIARLRALLDEAGLDRRRWVQDRLGRPIDGWGDISADEGDWLITRAEGERGPL